MYDLQQYKDKDPQALKAFMLKFPFATVIGSTRQGEPVATQLPLMIEEREEQLYLSGHLMRSTDHHKAFLQNPKVLCLFTSPHTYVSATWYHNPHQASTWNYMSVHAKGELRFLEEADLIEVLRKTTLHFEGGNIDSTTVYDQLSPDYISKLIKAIVAFEIRVTSLSHVFKLSQNRDQQSYRNIMEKLAGQDHSGAFISEEMKKREAEIFPDASRH